MSGYTRFGAEGPAGRMLFGTRSNVLSAWPTQGDATTQQVDAVKMIQRQWRLRAHILERYAPYFFSQRSQEPASFGTIRFKGNTHRSVRRNQAEWVRLSSEEFHARSPRVLLLLERFWKLKTPSLIISVTGAAQNIQLAPVLAQKFAQGLSSVLKGTDAWVITGGTQHGVMQLVGAALDEYAVTSPLIGIVPWVVVKGRAAMQAAHDRGQLEPHEYEPGASTTAAVEPAGTVSLQPNHDFFLLIDQPLSDSEYDRDPTAVRFGADIEPRARLELAAVQCRSIPQVLLVVSGGVGTFGQVLRSVEHGCPVVLVAGSGQVADALHAVNEQLARELRAAERRGDAKPEEAACAACQRNAAFQSWLATLRPSEAETAKLRARLGRLCAALARKPHLLRTFDEGHGDGGGGAGAHGSGGDALDVVLLEAILADDRPAEYAEAAHTLKIRRLCMMLRRRGQAAQAAHIEAELHARVQQGSTEKGGLSRTQLAKQLRLACEWRRVDIATQLTAKISRWAAEPTRPHEREARQQAALTMARDAAQSALSSLHVNLATHLLTGEQVPYVKAWQLDLLSLFRTPHRFGLLRRDAGLHAGLRSLREAKFAFVLPLEDGKLPGHSDTKYETYARGYAKVLEPFYAQFDPIIASFVGRVKCVSAAHFFLWAIVMAELQLAELFLDRCKQPLRMCLAGARLCAVLAEHPDVEADAYRQIQVRLEDTALEIIDRASENSRDVAYRLMIRACPKWSGLCPLELAVDFQVESFLAHRTVQLIVAGEWWRGKYPGSPLSVHPSSSWLSALLDCWLPFLSLATLSSLSTDEIGLPHYEHGASEAAGGGSSVPGAGVAVPPTRRLANVGQMRAAVEAIASADFAARAMRSPIEARLQTARRGLDGGHAAKVKGAGQAREEAGAERGAAGLHAPRHQPSAIRTARAEAAFAVNGDSGAAELLAQMARRARLNFGAHWQPPVGLIRLLHRYRFMHLLHVPMVKFATRFFTYACYLGYFLVVVDSFGWAANGTPDHAHGAGAHSESEAAGGAALVGGLLSNSTALDGGVGETDGGAGESVDPLTVTTTTHFMRLLLSPRAEWDHIMKLEPGDPDCEPLTRLELGFAAFSLCMLIDEVWQLVMMLTNHAFSGRPIKLSAVNAVDWLVYPLVVLSTAARYALPGLRRAQLFTLALLVYPSTLRLLEFTSIYKPVGVLMNTFVKMTIDVATWMLLLGTFVVAATFLYHGLFSRHVTSEAEGLGAGGAQGIIFQLFSNANPTVWSMFGEYQGDTLCSELSSDSTASDLGACVAETVAVWGNVLVMQIILVNLLIAMMSETYSLSTARADSESRANQVKRTLDYITNYFVLPPPLNAPILAVLLPIWAVQVSFHRMCCSPRDENGRPPPNVASHLLATLATPHKSRDDVLLLKDIRKSQPMLLSHAREPPGLLFERMTSPQRHFSVLTGLELIHSEVESLARTVGVLQRTLLKRTAALASADLSNEDDADAASQRASTVVAGAFADQAASSGRGRQHTLTSGSSTFDDANEAVGSGINRRRPTDRTPS